MIRYILDTDVLSYLMKRRFPSLQARLNQIDPADCAISAITSAEILFGLEAFAPFHPARERALEFLTSMQVLNWPASAAPIYAQLKHQTRQQPIGDHDLLIAAHAIALNATLVTNNTRHFGRIGDPLVLENWLW